MHTIAIGLAVIAALCLAVGTHLQHRAVARAAAFTGPRRAPRRLLWLLGSPVWLLGLALLALETLLNMVALGLAPVSLVQPIGTLSLVAAVILGLGAGRPSLRVLGGIGLTILATGLFVEISARSATAPEAAAPDLLVITFLLVGLTGLGAVLALSTVGHAVRIVTAGALFGLVATGTHALLHGLRGSGSALAPLPDALRPVHVALVVALIGGSVVGMWVVQTAYASGPPETVLAGLTVIDPLTAVVVGAAVLGEYSAMPVPVLLALLLTAAGAVAGVLLLVHVHPAVVRSQPRPHPTPQPQFAPVLHGAQSPDTRE